MYDILNAAMLSRTASKEILIAEGTKLNVFRIKRKILKVLSSNDDGNDFRFSWSFEANRN